MCHNHQKRRLKEKLQHCMCTTCCQCYQLWQNYSKLAVIYTTLCGFVTKSWQHWQIYIKGRILLFIFSAATIHFGKRITQWATLLSHYTNAALNLKDTYYGSNVTLSAFFQDSNEKTAKMDIYLPFSADFCMAFSSNISLENSKLGEFFRIFWKILIIQYKVSTYL